MEDSKHEQPKAGEVTNTVLQVDDGELRLGDAFDPSSVHHSSLITHHSQTGGLNNGQAGR